MKVLYSKKRFLWNSIFIENGLSSSKMASKNLFRKKNLLCMFSRSLCWLRKFDSHTSGIMLIDVFSKYIAGAHKTEKEIKLYRL